MHLLAASMLPPAGMDDFFGRFVSYQVVGFVVVLLALTILYWIFALADRFFTLRSGAAGPVECRQPGTQPVPDADEDPRILAAIAAAVSIALENRTHHIVDIVPAAKITPLTRAWAIEGRFEQFSSHNFRQEKIRHHDQKTPRHR